MRPTSPAWSPTITAAHRIAVRVSSWRSGQLLAVSVPITDGAVTYDDTAMLKRRLTITVPARMPDGTVWDPGDSADHPLAAYGQRLQLKLGIELPTRAVELMEHGWYLITGWQRDESAGQIQVEAVDLAVLLEDARHYREESPPAGNTYAQEFTRLADGILPTRIQGLPLTTTVNPQTVWERERTKNLDDLCRAWGARWHVADDGVLTASPAYAELTPTTPYVARLVSGRRGTVVARTRRGERSTLYNAVVVNGKTSGTGEPAPFGVAEITDPTSPIRVDGPYGRRPRFYASELLTDNAQCLAAAHTMLTAASSVSRSEPIQASPDPALELGDVVQVATGGSSFTGRVTGLALPLTASGPMTVTLASQPAANDTQET